MPEVTNEFISQQLERVIDRLGAIEDQITVLTGMVMRLDGSVAGRQHGSAFAMIVDRAFADLLKEPLQ